MSDAAISELGSVLWHVTPRGQIEIESKVEMRRRGCKSPDHADALAMLFADTGGPQEWFEYFQKREVERAAKPQAHNAAQQPPQSAAPARVATDADRPRDMATTSDAQVAAANLPDVIASRFRRPVGGPIPVPEDADDGEGGGPIAKLYRQYQRKYGIG